MATSLTHDQKAAINSFCELTLASERIAIVCLSRYNYALERAVNHYYQNQQKYVEEPGSDEKGVQKLFERYANRAEDKLPGKIGPNGMSSLLADLNLEAEDRKVLILAFKMDAEVMCEFSWAEWQKGMKEMRADSLDSLRTRLDEINRGLRESSHFKPLYQFAFKYAKNTGQRNLELTTALVYWKILLKDELPILSLWLEYMKSEYGKGVTRDTWNLFYQFAFTTKPDFSNYDEDGAWPVVVDNFVKWARPRQCVDIIEL